MPDDDLKMLLRRVSPHIQNYLRSQTREGISAIAHLTSYNPSERAVNGMLGRIKSMAAIWDSRP